MNRHFLFLEQNLSLSLLPPATFFFYFFLFFFFPFFARIILIFGFMFVSDLRFVWSTYLQFANWTQLMRIIRDSNSQIVSTFDRESILDDFWMPSMVSLATQHTHRQTNTKPTQNSIRTSVWIPHTQFEHTNANAISNYTQLKRRRWEKKITQSATFTIRHTPNRPTKVKLCKKKWTEYALHTHHTHS